MQDTELKTVPPMTAEQRQQVLDTMGKLNATNWIRGFRVTEFVPKAGVVAISFNFKKYTVGFYGAITIAGMRGVRQYVIPTEKFSTQVRTDVTKAIKRGAYVELFSGILPRTQDN